MIVPDIDYNTKIYYSSQEGNLFYIDFDLNNNYSEDSNLIKITKKNLLKFLISTTSVKDFPSSI